MKNRTRETCTSGSVRDEDGNVLIYSANDRGIEETSASCEARSAPRSDPTVATGDSGCEAYTAIAWGVGLSHERSDVAGAEGFYSLVGNMCGTAMRGADALPGSKAPHHVQKDRIGSWEVSYLAVSVA